MQGEIEKGEEVVGFPESPVKKKGRKRARAAAAPSEDDQNTDADGGEGRKKARQEGSASEGGPKAKRPRKVPSLDLCSSSSS